MDDLPDISWVRDVSDKLFFESCKVAAAATSSAEILHAWISCFNASVSSKRVSVSPQLITLGRRVQAWFANRSADRICCVSFLISFWTSSCDFCCARNDPL